LQGGGEEAEGENGAALADAGGEVGEGEATDGYARLRALGFEEKGRRGRTQKPAVT
jgi:hypothetical protein